MRPIIVQRELDCDSDPCALWDVITNTDHLNRAIGMAPVNLSPLDDEGAARYLVHTRLGGFAVEYEEQPYEWVRPERFGVVRRMRRGPLLRLEMMFLLAPRAAGSRLTLRLTLSPRFAVLAPIIRIEGGGTLGRFVRLMRGIDRDLATRREVYLCHAPRVSAAALGRASAGLLAAVEEGARPLARRLVAWVEKGEDTAVDRLRPFALAERWGEDPQAVLSVCLHAVSAGLLRLSWDLICPSCRTASARLPSLNEFDGEGHCHLCDIRFGLDLDRAVEATFRPAEAVRQIDIGPYCIGGPAMTPHVLAQLILPPDGSVSMPAPADPGRYRLFIRGGETISVNVVAGAPREVHLLRGASLPAQVDLAPGGSMIVAQQGGDERHVKLERSEWAQRAATAHEVSLNPIFRRLFAKEALKPGLSLSVGRVVLLFSDLTGSTALYSRIGDALAFRLVYDHFELLHEIIEAEGGVVIKTIGDAVMAAFSHEEAAVRAAIQALRGFASWQVGAPQGDALGLKLGLYAGPCYAVTANGVLDYFGQTVNTAARLQGLAGAGEIVLPQELAAAVLGDGEALREGIEIGAPFAALLKGLAEPMQAVRIRLRPAPA